MRTIVATLTYIKFACISPSLIQVGVCVYVCVLMEENYLSFKALSFKIQ